jgi:hypothetical protein
MFANPLFYLKFGWFKARVHRVAQPCKYRFLRSGGFRHGISRKQSPSCQCSRISFYENCHNFITCHFSGTEFWLGRSRKTVPVWPQWKTNFNFYVGVRMQIYVWWIYIHVRYTDPGPVGSGSYWSDPDLWKNYGTYSWQSMRLRVVAKSTGSEKPDLKSMDAPLNGP